MKKQTVFTLAIIVFVLSFFLTPLGYHGKVWLNSLFSFSPTEVALNERQVLTDYEWNLKDENWDFFSFSKSRGKVVFINFWASWDIRSAAELQDVQTLYNDYGDKVDFYIITNEEQAPVETFMRDKKYTFPVTYLIIGDKSPVETSIVPSSYVIDKNGMVVVRSTEIKDWDNSTVRDMLDRLLLE